MKGSRNEVASLSGENRAPDLSGRPVAEILNRAGQIEKAASPTLLAYNVRLGNYQAATGHNIADVFWRFMTAQGPVDVGGTVQPGVVFDWT